MERTGSVAELGRRERKKRDTRRALESAALRLFAERGFDATTIDDITAAVDVSPRTFFRYFATKEDVVLVDYEERLVLLRRVLAERPADEPLLVSVRHAVLALADRYSAEQHEALLRRFRLMLATPALGARNLALQTAWEEAIAAAAAARLGVPVDELRARLLAAAAVAALRVALTVWVADDGREPLPRLVERALDELAVGFGRPTPGPADAGCPA